MNDVPLSSIRDYQMEGWLTKRNNFSYSFCKRWFVLRGCHIYYYKSVFETSSCKNSIQLLSSYSLTLQKGCRKNFGFVINTGKKGVLLSIEDEKEGHFWVEYIFKIIQKSQSNIDIAHLVLSLPNIWNINPPELVLYYHSLRNLVDRIFIQDDIQHYRDVVCLSSLKPCILIWVSIFSGINLQECLVSLLHLFDINEIRINLMDDLMRITDYTEVGLSIIFNNYLEYCWDIFGCISTPELANILSIDFPIIFKILEWLDCAKISECIQFTHNLYKNENRVIFQLPGNREDLIEALKLISNLDCNFNALDLSNMIMNEDLKVLLSISFSKTRITGVGITFDFTEYLYHYLVDLIEVESVFSLSQEHKIIQIEYQQCLNENIKMERDLILTYCSVMK